MSTTPVIADFQKRATTLSEARDALSTLFLGLQADLDAAKALHIAGIRQAARKVAREHTALVEMIEATPELFKSPRTYVVEGIKFGMRASTGSLDWEDDEKVVAGLRRLVQLEEITPETADMCINTVEKPISSSLAKLEEKHLRRIGVAQVGAGDQPIIKSVDSNIEKAVMAVINAAIKEAEIDK